MTREPMDQPELPGKRVNAVGPAKIVMVNFRRETLFAVEWDDGVFVAVKPIVQSMGLDWKAQHRRLSEDAILMEGMVTMTIPSVGGAQETTCLRLDLVNGWLFAIDESRVKDEETRQKVLAYKRECYSALFHHFYGRRNAPGDETHEANAPKVKMVTEVRHTFGVPAAKQLWLQLQLPVVPAMVEASGQGDLFKGLDEKAA